MTITTSDIPRIAAAIRTAGELLEAHGELMLTLTAEWATGAKAANLDPDGRRNRYEDCGDPTCQSCPHAIPTDPTGEAILNARTDLHAELRRRLDRILTDAHWLRDTTHVLAPIVPPSTMNDPGDLWCTHHIRIGLAEPRHRKDLCRYCSDFLALWNVRPPVSILRDRHDGKRITDKTMKAALEADGLILKEVGGVTKAVRQNRRPNQNVKRKAG